ncbi:hypothetical protein [Mariniblastus fucicola]|nr:hypothetical protein [Mariniblastus fucicola]
MSRYCFRICAAVFFTAVLAASGLAQQQYRFATENFTVVAPDPAFARQVGNEAERFRKELAIQWIGEALPTWSEKCPIQVKLAAHAGGETSFAFMYNGQQRGEPTGWDMKIFGTPERLLDSVLPHEVTHTIFATHFRRPLPRWADEGACTTVEHVAEKKKNHGMLIHFLTSQPSRGIPFNRMFTMRDYPQDILPLYAQGYSVAKFLIMEKGRRHFLDYVRAGMDMEQPGRELNAWNRATKQFYGYDSLSDLQVKWERWVADGSIEKAVPSNQTMLASANVGPRSDFGSKLNQHSQLPRATTASAASDVADDGRLASLNEGWYAKQMKVGRRYRPDAQAQEKAAPTARNETIWR